MKRWIPVFAFTILFLPLLLDAREMGNIVLSPEDPENHYFSLSLATDQSNGDIFLSYTITGVRPTHTGISIFSDGSEENLALFSEDIGTDLPVLDPSFLAFDQAELYLLIKASGNAKETALYYGTIDSEGASRILELKRRKNL